MSKLLGFKEFDTAKQQEKELHSVIQYSPQLQTSSAEEQIQGNRLFQIKEASLKPVLIITQASLYLEEDFQVIINEKWKYCNQYEFYLLFTHSIFLSLK